MGRTIVFDIESNGLVELDYSSFPYKLRDGYKIHCIAAVVDEIDNIYTWVGDEEIGKFKDFIQEGDILVGHNIIDFDLPILSLYTGFDYKISANIHKKSVFDDYDFKVYDLFNGKKIKICDTLLLSKLLNPDRLGGHSLDAWGKTIGEYKQEYKGGFEKYSKEMLHYNIQDVKVNMKLYNRLREEIIPSQTQFYEEAYTHEAAMADIVHRSSHFGFKFDVDHAKWCVEDLQQKMKEIEDKVHPILPMYELPKSKQPNFPKLPFKSNGDLSVAGKNWAAKFGITDEDEVTKLITDIHAGAMEVPKLQEKMQIKNQDNLKQYLLSIGWIPTAWNESDLLTANNVEKSIDLYVNKTIGSDYEPFRRKFLKISDDVDLKEYLLNKIKEDKVNRVIIRTTPLYTIDLAKNLCPNLIKLGDKFPFVQDIVNWLVYRHRKNTILSDNEENGLLTKYREVDGKINTPADTIGAASFRFRHSVVVNVPRCGSTYGEHMRQLFTVPEGCWQLGSDASGLEARCEGHFCYTEYGGKEYVKELLDGDIHTVNSEKLGLTRSEAKQCKYALSYGCQAATLAQYYGWSSTHAKSQYDKFWNENKSLKSVVDGLVSEWQSNNKKHIKGIDGRQLITRYKHSLLNTLLQSTGIIIMKRQHIAFIKQLEDDGLYFDIYKDTSFDGKVHAMIFYHDELQLCLDNTLVRAKEFDDKESAENFKKTLDSKFICGNITENAAGKYVVGWSKVGENCIDNFKLAGEYYKLNVPIGADYQIGRSWKECH